MVSKNTLLGSGKIEEVEKIKEKRQDARYNELVNKAQGKLYSVSKLVKVTIGGCGG